MEEVDFSIPRSKSEGHDDVREEGTCCSTGGKITLSLLAVGEGHEFHTHFHPKSFPVNSSACWNHHDTDYWGQGRNREAHNLPPPTPCRLIYDKRSQAIFLRITSVGNIISVWPLGTRACFAPNTASAHLVCLAGSGETHSICAPKTLLSQLHYVSFNFHSPFFLFIFPSWFTAPHAFPGLLKQIDPMQLLWRFCCSSVCKKYECSPTGWSSINQ